MLSCRTNQALLIAGMLVIALLLASCNDSESISSPTGPGSAVVTGTVVSGDETTGTASSGSGLAGVTVRVLRTGQVAQTDGAGNFTLVGVPAGDQQFQFSRGDIDARATISVTGGATVAFTAAISRRSTVVVSPRGNSGRHSPEQTVTATQTPTPGTPTPAASPTARPVEQIEGIVVANSGGILTIFDQRLGTVMVTVTPTTIIRKGGTPLTLDQVLVGMRVHVMALLETAGTYTALEIIVQNEHAATATPSIPTATNTPTVTPSASPTNTPGVTPTETPTP